MVMLLLEQMEHIIMIYVDNMKTKFLTLFIINTIFSCYSQNLEEYEDILDTLYFREFITDNTSVLNCLDSTLQLSKFGELDSDEVYYLELSKKPKFIGVIEVDKQNKYYLTISKEKRTNNIKYVNAKMGYIKYKKQIIFLTLYNDDKELFRPTGNQKTFTFYDIKKLENLLDPIELADLIFFAKFIEFQYINEKFVFRSSAY